MFFLFCYHKRYVLLDRPASTRETRDIPQWLIRSTCNLRFHHEHLLFIERLKVATTFDFMGTLNCSLFVVGCSNAVSKSENFFISSRGNKSKTESELPQNQKWSLFSEKRSFISASGIVKVQEFLFFICRGQRKKKSKMRIQGRLYLFYLFFAPAVIYLTFWKNEKFTSQVQLNYLKTKRQGHHPLY